SHRPLYIRGGLEKLKTIYKAVFAVVMGMATVWSFEIPDVAFFQAPGFARIFLWHFPCPMLFTFLILTGAYFSIRGFLTPEGSGPGMGAVARAEWDTRAVACMELSYLYALLTMATGIMFSWIQWGAWWSWDPRQTSFLMVLLIYAAYFAVRFAYTDAGKRAAYSSGYA